MTIRPLVATCATAALVLLAGCEEQTTGSASPQPSAVPGPSSAPGNSTTPPTSSSSAPATSASAPAASKPAPAGAAAHTPDGAAGVLEEYHHALGAKDLTVACRITAPAFDGGMKECRQNTTILFEMFSPDDLRKLKTTRVNRSMVQSKGADKVTVPAAAIAPKAAIMESDNDPMTMEWRNGAWIVTG